MYAAVTWIMIGATVSLGTATAATGSSLPADGTGWTAAVAAAIVSTAVAVGLFLLGVRSVGAGHAAVLSTIEPVVTIVVGVAALDERLGPSRIVGAILVIGAVVVLAARSDEARTQPATVGAGA
jgi:drug/metabolite transporter (DMT)-like permease